jgi:hypothetical protein
VDRRPQLGHGAAEIGVPFRIDGYTSELEPTLRPVSRWAKIYLMCGTVFGVGFKAVQASPAPRVHPVGVQASVDQHVAVRRSSAQYRPCNSACACIAAVVRCRARETSR